ncbi:GNAT family N-acetyltransferase [Maribacter sp. MAR_2009_72]|uniref:GNAT family N-acetyltransferase n=1 Tax=Maribacter sp. MAR_2009_72 TaxID=1250050 RepID=UPI00119B99F2|nr:GNAT family protein [Maribacter sp. MAR_2009_72]TVZ13876.1 RimJ/RimL family protein N-acetyltransferase [Maribacter sp. MAR_2009_72]
MISPVLQDDRVMLSPLTSTNYKELIDIALQDKLVQYSPSEINTPNSLRNYVEIALQQAKAGTSIPYIIYDKKFNKYAGSTRFMNINLKNKVLHIGSTWIGKEFHGTGLNSHMKELMLTYAFNTLGFEKVEFRVDERNIASRKAIEKLGCTLEGILRKNVYLLDGFKRNTCCYGLLKNEWAAKQ